MMKIAAAELSKQSGGIIFRDDHFVPENTKPVPYIIKKLKPVVEGRSVVLYGAMYEDISAWKPELICRCNYHKMGETSDIRFIKMYRVGRDLYKGKFKPLTGISSLNLLLQANAKSVLIAGWDFYLSCPPYGVPKEQIKLHSMKENIEAFTQLTVSSRVQMTRGVMDALRIYKEFFC